MAVMDLRLRGDDADFSNRLAVMGTDLPVSVPTTGGSISTHPAQNCQPGTIIFDEIPHVITTMTLVLKRRIVSVCEQKIKSKGPTVGLSFYAFFKNKNDNPQELMEAATWWIQTQELDHFEKAVKIRDMVLREI